MLGHSKIREAARLQPQRSVTARKVDALAMHRVSETFIEVAAPIVHRSSEQLEAPVYAHVGNIFLGDMYDLLMEQVRGRVQGETRTQVKNLRLST